MKAKFWLILGLIAAVLASVPAALWASACQAEIGEWAQFKKAPSAEELSGIKQLPVATAKLFSGPRGIVNAKADPNQLAGNYKVRPVWTNSRLEFKFYRNGRAVGGLLLERPRLWTFFQAESKPLRTGDGTPQMYKEIRLTGKLQAAGALALRNAAGAKFRLIFQGAGGHCFEAGDFTRWVLMVYGPDPENPAGEQAASYYSIRGSL